MLPWILGCGTAFPDVPADAPATLPAFTVPPPAAVTAAAPPEAPAPVPPAAPTAIALAPPAADTPWPISTFEGETAAADEDGDGVPERRSSGMDGGSGWKTFTTCVRHGASGHMACSEDVPTAYSLFAGARRVLDPPVDNRAAALLPEHPCARRDPDDPAQGAMEALKLEAPLSGAFRPALRWFPGPPVDQVSVCMSLAEAAGYPGGLTWDAAGGDGSGVGGAEAGWTAWYAAAWPQWTSEGGSNRTPRRVATLGVRQVYQHGHALAVYDPARDRHAWIANFGHSTEGFKVDRWERIGAIVASGTTLEVEVAEAGGGGVVRIELGR